MQSVDLNLLVVLDALLQEGSVSGAAKRLQLAPSSVSRSLTRLRKTINDPLFVRTGRQLAPTPRALEMAGQSHQLLSSIRELLAPPTPVLTKEAEAKLTRTFIVRAGPDNAAGFGPALLSEVHSRAPKVVIKFVDDGDRAAENLRDGRIDLVLGGALPETADNVHREQVLTDSAVIAGRRDGDFARLCHDRQPTVADIVAHPYIDRFPRSTWYDALDSQLTKIGKRRTVVATAPGFAAVFSIVRGGDLICVCPSRLSSQMHGESVDTWTIPLVLPHLVIELAWHDRTHHDPEHRWLRDRCRAAMRGVAFNLPDPEEANADAR